MLLEPQFLDRLERLALQSKQRVAGAYPGEHRSKRLGSSLDFADWRQYVPGDDFRRIDYQIYARLDRLLIKLFEAQDELSLRVVVDASASMGFENKLSFAARAAGALAYLASCRKDRAAIWAAGGDGALPGPPIRSRESALIALEWLETIRPSGGVSLPSALKRVSAGRAPRGITILISDLLSEDWEASIRAAGGPGNPAIVIHLLGPLDKNPAERGDLLLVDSETNAALDVSVSDQMLKQYQKRLGDWLTAVAGACLQRGMGYALASPQDSVEGLLLGPLAAQGLIR